MAREAFATQPHLSSIQHPQTLEEVRLHFEISVWSLWSCISLAFSFFDYNDDGHRAHDNGP